ncbi:MAG: serine/threonine protein kinase [Gemmataceae bacterium]|nr:serine/threonine protein kinase [Gemmataceae bacterium]
MSVAQFVHSLRESGLLPSAEVQALAANVPASRNADGKRFAQDLVEQQKLTRYQAAMLYQGKVKGLVLGHYVILDKLGQGGMGMVFKARHRQLNRIVALKVLPPAVGKDPAAVKRFEREVRAASQLNHPHIVAAQDADQADGIHFLVMDYIDGSDLSQLVKRQGPLSVSLALACILQAGRGLAAAHAAGITHRDIKPGNLLIDAKGTVKVLDLGLARFDTGNTASPQTTSSDDLTRTGSILGTTDYMAPEQAVNTKRADHRADIYSLGCTLFYLLTGRSMYGGETSMERLLAHREQPIPSLRQARSDVPAVLDTVFQRMVAKRPEDRYASMTAVLADLEACAEHATLPPRPRRIRRWGLAGAFSMAALVILAFAAMRPTERTGPPQSSESNASATSPATPPPTRVTVPLSGVDEKRIKEIRGKSPQEQVSAVAAWMKELNPKFDGVLTPRIEGPAVIGLSFNSRYVTNLVPIQTLSALRILHCGATFQNRSKLSDLSPLAGLNLHELDCACTDVRDLSPLRGMKLNRLSIRETKVASLADLSSMPLTSLTFSDTSVHDLAPLTGMPLQLLECWRTPVHDLRSVNKTTLKLLNCGETKVEDLSPLAGGALEEFRGSLSPERTEEVLRGFPLLRKFNDTVVLDVRKALDETKAIPRWQVLKPFPQKASLPFDLRGNAGALVPAEFNRKYDGLGNQLVAWQQQDASPMGLVSLKPAAENASAFAYAILESPAERTVDFLTGGDDFLTVWVNGEPVHEVRQPRAWMVNTDRFRVRLRKGANHIMVRCDNLKGEWAFSVRVSR